MNPPRALTSFHPQVKPNTAQLPRSHDTACRSVPVPPRYDHWPVALRSAALLRGSIVRCGPGLRGVGWPETPSVRLAALSPWLEGKRVATHEAAAWVWGAAREPGTPLRVSSRSRGRTINPEYTSISLQETRFRANEILHHGDCAVTTPLRTIIDFLYDDTELDTKKLIIVRLLVRSLPDHGHEIRQYFARNRRPYRTRALKRWCQIYP